MQDMNEKLRLTCGVTAAHCHWSRARSESDDSPAHTRFKGNSIRDTGRSVDAQATTLRDRRQRSVILFRGLFFVEAH